MEQQGVGGGGLDGCGVPNKRFVGKCVVVPRGRWIDPETEGVSQGYTRVQAPSDISNRCREGLMVRSRCFGRCFWCHIGSIAASPQKNGNTRFLFALQREPAAQKMASSSGRRCQTSLLFGSRPAPSIGKAAALNSKLDEDLALEGVAQPLTWPGVPGHVSHKANHNSKEDRCADIPCKPMQL